MKQGKGKNNQFKQVNITTNTIQGEPAIVEAIKVDGTLAKLSRNERKILASYKSKTYRRHSQNIRESEYTCRWLLCI